MSIDQPSHVVAILGGACAGSAAAELLAESGCEVVVFDQNARPYGKIEDGLPRWHDKQRRMEYEKINVRLDRDGVTYVPCTRLGADIDFRDIATGWGFSAVILANGAWKDRPLEIPGAALEESRGLVYQNPLIYWFNHRDEAGYDGPHYRIADRTVVIGGGLASIDVIKIVQLDLYAHALAAHGIKADVIEMEHHGIPRFLAAHGIDDPASVGVQPGVLVYRRRIADMPLAPIPADATQAQLAKAESVREKILKKCQDRFLFDVRAQTLPVALRRENDSLVGLDVRSTRVDGRRALPVEGTEETLPADLVISSIGSVPEPIPGIEMDGVYYRFADESTGAYVPIPGVFGVGNVITGQGNIKVSHDHGRQIARSLIEGYLGIGETEDRDVSGATEMATSRGASLARAVDSHLAAGTPLSVESARALIERARSRQREVGFTSTYRDWIAANTPADMI